MPQKNPLILYFYYVICVCIVLCVYIPSIWYSVLFLKQVRIVWLYKLYMYLIKTPFYATIPPPMCYKILPSYVCAYRK